MPPWHVLLLAALWTVGAVCGLWYAMERVTA